MTPVQDHRVHFALGPRLAAKFPRLNLGVSSATSSWDQLHRDQRPHPNSTLAAGALSQVRANGPHSAGEPPL